jgi:uncharacterized RDD family membrane protein YckC
MSSRYFRPSYLGYYAGFMSRLFAFAIDMAITLLSTVAVTWLVSVTNTVFRLSDTYHLLGQRFPQLLALFDAIFHPAVGSVLVLAFIIAYHALFLTLLGQTPGKILVGIRVLTVKGKPLSFWRAVLRVLAYMVSAIPLYLGFLWVLVDDRRQAWHDKLMGTYVVYAWSARPDERFLSGYIDKLQARFSEKLLPPESKTN